MVVPVALSTSLNFNIPEELVSSAKGVILDGRAINWAGLPLEWIGAWMTRHSFVPTVIALRDETTAFFVNYDNEEAMFRMTSHMLETHGSKAPVYFGGPAKNQAAVQRRLGYLRALSEAGVNNPIEINSNGFDLPAGEEMARNLIVSKCECDAVICATDEIALGMRNEFLKQNQRMLPYTGFDNRPFVLNQEPQLTTMHYDESELANTAASTLWSLITRDGDSAEPIQVRVPIKMICRTSCGCSLSEDPITFRDFLEKDNSLTELISPEFQGFLKTGLSKNPLWLKNWEESVVQGGFSKYKLLRLQRFFYDQTLHTLTQEFKDLDQVFIEAWNLEEGIMHYENFIQSTKIEKLMLSFSNARHWAEMRQGLKDFFDDLGLTQWSLSFTFEEEELGLKQQDFPTYFTQQNQDVYYSPIIFEETLIGYLSWYPLEKLNPNSTRMVRHLLNNQIKIIQALKKELSAKVRLQDAVNLLEHHNLQLVETSERDQLTGLYNRRGFFSKGFELWQRAKLAERQSLVLFADLDGLKTINDTYGHAAGDKAILGASQVLFKTFRKSDLLCRQGGDEFIAVLNGLDERALTIVQNRVKLYTEQWNSQNPYPWKLVISLGGCS